MLFYISQSRQLSYKNAVEIYMYVPYYRAYKRKCVYIWIESRALMHVPIKNVGQLRHELADLDRKGHMHREKKHVQ